MTTLCLHIFHPPALETALSARLTLHHVACSRFQCLYPYLDQGLVWPNEPYQGSCEHADYTCSRSVSLCDGFLAHGYLRRSCEGMSVVLCDQRCVL